LPPIAGTQRGDPAGARARQVFQSTINQSNLIVLREIGHVAAATFAEQRPSVVV
jgi:hypothetical protein